MAIRKFVAPTTREAMMQVRRELGEDAVILANKRVGNRIEVLAAAPDAVEALVERSESQSAALRERVPAAERAAPEARQPARPKVEAFQDFVRRQMQVDAPEPAQEPARQASVRPGAGPAARGQAAVSMYHDVAEIEGDELPMPPAKPARAAPPKPEGIDARHGVRRQDEPGEGREAPHREPTAVRKTATIQSSHRSPQIEMETPRADPAVFRRRPAHVAPAASRQAAAAAGTEMGRAGPATAAELAIAKRAPAHSAAARVQPGAAAASVVSAGSACVPSMPAPSRPAAMPKVDIELAADAPHVSWMESAQVAIPRVESMPQTAVRAVGPQPQAVAPAAAQAIAQSAPPMAPPLPHAVAQQAMPPQPAQQVPAQALHEAVPQAIAQPSVQPILQHPIQPIVPVPQQLVAQPAAQTMAQRASQLPQAVAQGLHAGLQAIAPAQPPYAPLPHPATDGGYPEAGPTHAAVWAPAPVAAATGAPVALPAGSAPALAQPAVAQTPPVAIALPAAQPSAVETRLLAELQTMRNLLQGQLANISGRPAEAAPQNAAGMRVTTRLLTAGFSVDVARRIAAHVPAALDLAQAEGWLLDVLAHNIRCAAPEEGIVERAGRPGSPGQVFALVGPTGVGKTTTVAKLAARFAVKHGTSALGLVTLDAYRVAAPEQLRTYGRILGTPVHLAQDAAALRELLATLAHKRLVLIDTCGVSQRDQRLGEMHDLLAAAGVAGRPIQRVLLLNSGSHAETLDEAARAWRAPECSGAILTKLDEASRIGGALDAALRHRLALLGLTNGQRVPEDWHGANGRLLAHLALKPAAQLFELADDEGAALARAAPVVPALGAAHGATHV